jgi:hypothetical protein
MRINIVKRINVPANLLPLSVIIILSLIPAYYTRGSLNIGGDVMIFLDTSVLATKYLYQWIVNESNGQYLSTSYYALFGLYKLLSLFRFDIYQISFTLLFALNFIAGLAMWKLAKVFNNEAKSYIYIIPITFYLLSPALFNGWHYSVIYAFIPWFVYLTFKIIKNKLISRVDIFYFALIILFSSTELPNPKYLFHLLVIFVASVTTAFVIKLIDWSCVKQIAAKSLLILLLSSYIFVPLGYFAAHYSSDQYGVHVKENYSDEGKMMNSGVDTVDRVFKLHQDFIFINQIPAKSYNTNILLKMLGYAFIFIIVLSLLNFEKLSPTQKKLRLVLLSLFLIYVYFSAGPNPPLGFFYEAVVSKYSLFAFLRTTGGGVFFLSVFYAILLFLFLSDLKKYKLALSVIILIIICGVGYPFINGEYYKNYNNVSKFTDRNQYGFKIPEEYARVKELLVAKKIDAKIYYPNSKLVYIHTSWGFFGPIIYNFYFLNQNISYDKVYSSLANHNIGYVLIDNSIIEKSNFDTVAEKITILKEGFIDLANYSREKYLPHIFSARNIIVSDLSENNLLIAAQNTSVELRSMILLKSQNLGKNIDGPVTFENAPDIEYKKVNITKYKIIVHGAKGSFPLVFSESFHPGWKAYIMPANDSGDDENNLVQKLENYIIIPNNEDDQASKEELSTFIDGGLISNLGSQPKISFISKKYQGTIQNDNLKNGLFFETWGKDNVDEANHFKVNGYANAWLLDPDKICRYDNICQKNENGYDLNLIIEFMPQRIFYMSLLITLATAFLLLGHIVYVKIIKYKEIHFD